MSSASDERVAQYLRLDFLLFWTMLQVVTPFFFLPARILSYRIFHDSFVHFYIANYGNSMLAAVYLDTLQTRTKMLVEAHLVRFRRYPLRRNGLTDRHSFSDERTCVDQ